MKDLGECDDANMHFSTHNNFYYSWGHSLDLSQITASQTYQESPAKATGNDHFDNCPGQNDWYETVKLNYGVDYCDVGGKSEHFYPIPDTWNKMRDILLFWAAKGVDGFRCDMAEMVPSAFWAYATKQIKERYPHVVFIGEVYNPSLYRLYIASGFDYLYDKVGMYDSLRDIVCGRRWASDITAQWQQTDDIRDHMLYFLENHDEQRIASDFFAGDPWRAFPAHIVSCLLQTNPYMLYAGQELGERGMDKEGFSGCDGRTTIFDYWSLDTLIHGYYNVRQKTREEKHLMDAYKRVMLIKNEEKAVRQGQTFDLMYVNSHIGQSQFAFLRKLGDDLLLVAVNFAGSMASADITIPAHAFEFLNIPERQARVCDLLTGDEKTVNLVSDGVVRVDIPRYGGVIYKFNYNVMDEYILNEHNKEEFPPAHTAEHLLNQLMVRRYGCERSRNAHIERKKSKISYVISNKPSRKEEQFIEDEMNRLIASDMPVTYELVDRNHIPDDVHLDRLPTDASEMIRLVRIGDYDVCPCIGKHVRSTSQIGRFELLGTNWDEEKRTFRIRFKVVQ